MTPPVVWTPAPTAFTTRSVLMEVYGDTDTGRTTFALSAPAPIALIEFGEKIDGVVQRYAGKQIFTFRCGGVFRGGREKVMEAASAAEDAMFAALYDALMSTWARTIILDTHNEAWALSRNAEFGGAKPEKGRVDRNYAEINERWRSLLVACRASGKNVILIGMTDDEWTASQSGQDKKTGRTVRATHFKTIPIKVDVQIRTYSQKKADGQGKDFAVQIEKAWMNPLACGVILKNEQCLFSSVMAGITGTRPEEWS